MSLRAGPSKPASRGNWNRGSAVARSSRAERGLIDVVMGIG